MNQNMNPNMNPPTTESFYPRGDQSHQNIYIGNHHNERIVGTQNPGPSVENLIQKDHKIRSLEDEKNYLEDALRAKDIQLETMSINLLRKPAIEVVHGGPMIEHSVQCKPSIREVVYERDPYLVERNKQLKEELENALLSEQRAHAEQAMKIEEIGRLHVKSLFIKNNPKIVSNRRYKIYSPKANPS